MADNLEPTATAGPSAPSSQQYVALQQLLAQLQSNAVPSWDFSNETLTSLTKKNFTKWHASLTDILATHSFSHILTESFVASTDENRKAFASCRALITNSISEEVNELIPNSIFLLSPSQIVSHLKTMLEDSAMDIDQLLTDASLIRFDEKTGLVPYIEKHRRQQALLIEAGASEFSTDIRTVKIILRGLTASTNVYSTIAATLLATTTPSSISELHKALKAFESAITIHGAHHTPIQDAKPVSSSQDTVALDSLLSTMAEMSSTLRRIESKIAAQNRATSKNTRNYGSGSNKRQHKQAAAKQATAKEDDTDSQAQLLQALALLQEAQRTDNNDESKFLLDSGAHPTHTSLELTSTTALNPPIRTITADASSIPITKSGTLTIETDQKRTIQLPALISKRIRGTLVSVHTLAHKYGLVAFKPHVAYVIDTSHPRIIASAKWTGSGYYLKNPKHCPSLACAARAHHRPIPNTTSRKWTIPRSTIRHTKKRSKAGAAPSASLNRPKTTPTQSHPTKVRSVNDISQAFHEWHLKYNHIRPRTLQKMATLNLLDLPPILRRTPPPITCTGCIHGKLTPQPHKPAQHVPQIGRSLSSDVAGPINPTSVHGNRYFVVFLEKRTRFILVFCAANRTQLYHFTERVLNLMRTKFGTSPLLITTDNAGEYRSNIFQSILDAHGTQLKTSTPYSPQENSLVERVIGTLSRIVRETLTHAGLPNNYWEDALYDAVFKYNRTLHHTTKQIPYTMWHQSPPKVYNMFAFGQLGSIPILADKSAQRKLDARGTLARYLFGIDHAHVMVETLNEKQHKRVRSVDFHPYEPSTDPVRTTNMAFKASYQRSVPTQITSSTHPPLSRKQAQQFPDAKDWEAAHNAEIDKLDRLGVIDWTPLDKLPKRLIPLTMKYTYKRNINSQIVDHKARLAVRGDFMKPHQHFDPDHTSAHLAQKETVRLVLAVAASKQLHIEHFDVTTAYPHELYKYDKPVYVKQYPLFDGSLKHPTPGGRLVRNLYGNPSGFFYYLEGAVNCLQKLGYTQSNDDPCLFVQHHSLHHFTIICLNSDDYLVASTHQTSIDSLFVSLTEKYNIRRIGKPSTYLGWNILYTKSGIHISQPNYIKQALSLAQLSDCNPRASPHTSKAQFHGPTDDDDLMPSHFELYRQIVGILRWVTDCTRPDIGFAVSRLGQASHATTKRHWNLLKEVLRYLKVTCEYGILYPLNSNLYHMKLSFKTFADADFATDAKNRKSITGYILTLRGGPIAWTSSQQSCVALSTAEAEYIAATSAVQSTCFIRRVLQFLKLHDDKPSPLLVDNQSVLSIGQNTGDSKRRKFIDLRHHYLRQHLRRGNITL